jgi:hypothetical protein
MGYWGRVFKLAWGEARQEVRWDSPVRVVQNIGGPIVAGVVVWMATKQIAWSAVATLGVAALLAIAVFFAKVWGIPPRISAQAGADRRANERELESRNEDLRAQNERLRGEIHAIKNPPPPARDPDGIYQNGAQVGRVVGAIPDPQHSLVKFAEIGSDGSLNPEREFDYREWVLRIASSDASMEGNFGAIKTFRVINAICEVVRAR